MTGWVRLAGLAVVGCAAAPPPVLSVADWRVQPPAAACEARESRKSAIELRRYDAEGRLISAKNTLSSHERAAEWLTWEGKTLVGVDSYLERDATECDKCNSRNGSSLAVERTLQRSELHWQGAQLVSVTASSRIYRPDENSEGWRLYEQSDGESRFDYLGPRLKTMGPSTRFEFEGDRPVRRRMKTGLIFWDDSFDSWTWKDDRVVTYVWGGNTQRFDYDAQGRLIRDRLESATERNTRIKTWAYNERGAVRRMTEQYVSAQGEGNERVWEYEYDGGREVAVIGDGVRIETTYSGDCANVVEGPRAPNVFEMMNAAACYQSPGLVFHQCF